MRGTQIHPFFHKNLNKYSHNYGERTMRIISLLLIVLLTISVQPFTQAQTNKTTSLAKSNSTGIFKVNNDNDVYGTSQQYPELAVDGKGNYTIVWLDNRNGIRDIYGQRYNKAGEALGDNFRVNEADQFVDGWGLRIAASENGNFVVVWNDNSDGVKLQAFDSKGNRIGENVVLFTPSQSRAYSFSLIMINDNEFAVIWRSENIFIQKFNLDGKSISEMVKLNDTETLVDGSLQNSKSAVLNNNGSLAVVWSEKRNKATNIYAQLLTDSLKKKEQNICLNEIDMNKLSHYPSVIALNDTTYFAVWENRDVKYYYPDEIISQKFSTKRLGNNVRLNSTQPGFFVSTPGLIRNKDSFIVTWFEAGLANFSYYDLDGVRIGKPKTTSAIQYYPSNFSTAVDVEGSLICSWSSDRTRESDIFIQRFDNQLTPIGMNTFPVKDQGSSWQTNPTLAVSSDGSFITAWEDERTGNTNIYYKVFDKRGIALGEEKQANDLVTVGNADYGCTNPVAMAYLNGDYYLAWLNYSDIYLQKISARGEKLGPNYKINVETQSNIYDLQLTSDDENFIVVSWRGHTADFDGIFQRVVSSLSQLSAVLKIPTTSEDKVTYMSNSSYTINGKRETCIVWQNLNQQTWKLSDLLARVYDSKGNIKGSTWSLTNLSENVSVYGFVKSKNDNNFLICWPKYENYNSSELHFATLGSSGQLLDSEKKISSSSYGMHNPRIMGDQSGNQILYWDEQDELRAVKITNEINTIGNLFSIPKSSRFYKKYFYENGNIYSIWEDYGLPGKGRDIWMQIDSQFELAYKQSEISSVELFQNYPNPFNSQTSISYMLPEASNVKLRLFDSIGREVGELVNQTQAKGLHTVGFDGSRLASGVYFFQLETGSTIISKKLILLK